MNLPRQTRDPSAFTLLELPAVPKREGRAFTLLELLVVVVVIMLLVGILVPVLGGARAAARKRASEAQLTGLLGACQSYNLMMGAYPGYFTEWDVSSRLLNRFTGTENLVISLMGWVTTTKPTDYFEPDPDPSAKKYVDLDKVGTGPITAGSPPRQYDPFYSPKKDEIGVIQFDGLGGWWSGLNAKMPEFLDPSSGAPVLYYRGSRHNPNLVGEKAGYGYVFGRAANAGYIENTIKTADGDLYDEKNASLLSPYPTGAGNQTNAWANLAWCAKNPALGEVARGSVLLISPGDDGIYLDRNDPHREGANRGSATINSEDDLKRFDDVIAIGD